MIPTSRRDYIKSTAGVVSGIALAGCTGGSGGDGGDGSDGGSDSGGPDGGSSGGGSSGTTDIVMKTSDEKTGAFAMSQGIAAVVNENSDSVFVDARTSQGSSANIGEISRGSADMAYTNNWNISQVKAGAEQFGDISIDEFSQAFHYYDINWAIVTDEDWTSIADIPAGTKLCGGHASDIGGMMEVAYDTVLDDWERVDLLTPQFAPALSEGRTETVPVGYLNGLEPSWVQEIKSRVDASVLTWPEDAVQTMREDTPLEIREMDMTEYADGYARTPDTVNAVAVLYMTFVPRGFDSDAIYNMMKTMYDNREALAEFHPLLSFYKDPEFWVTNTWPDVPFNSGAAEFYKEVGVWKDEFTEE